MPVYTYECKKCGTVVERFGKYNDVVLCDRCKVPTIKIPSLSNFQLKGSGWAKDGYSK